jgi:hypothetical protein
VPMFKFRSPVSFERVHKNAIADRRISGMIQGIARVAGMLPRKSIQSRFFLDFRPGDCLIRSSFQLLNPSCDFPALAPSERRVRLPRALVLWVCSRPSLCAFDTVTFLHYLIAEIQESKFGDLIRLVGWEPALKKWGFLFRYPCILRFNSNGGHLKGRGFRDEVRHVDESGVEQGPRSSPWS